MSKTIKDLADELGVSKQAVRKQIDSLPQRCVSVGTNRAILINAEGARLLRKKISPKPPKLIEVDTTVGSTENTENPALAALLHQLEVKDTQLAEKDAQLAAKDIQLEKLTALLDHEQQLHGKTLLQLSAAPDPREAPAPAAASAEASPRPKFSIFRKR